MGWEESREVRPQQRFCHGAQEGRVSGQRAEQTGEGIRLRMTRGRLPGPCLGKSMDAGVYGDREEAQKGTESG